MSERISERSEGQYDDKVDRISERLRSLEGAYYDDRLTMLQYYDDEYYDEKGEVGDDPPPPPSPKRIW